MTHGEVYALLRRRRDERNAARHPPFGLQLVQADPNVRGGNMPPPTTVSNANRNPATAVLATPSSGHLVVLLSEVSLLHYLANYATISSDWAAAAAAASPCSVEKGEVGSPPQPSSSPSPAASRAVGSRLQAIYGPTSVYALQYGDLTLGDQSNLSPQLLRLLRGDESTSHDEDGSWPMSCYKALQDAPPGSVAHVQCVTELLSHFEAVGRSQERRDAAALRDALALHVLHLCPSRSTSGCRIVPSPSSTIVKQEASEEDPVSSPQPRAEAPSGGQQPTPASVAMQVPLGHPTSPLRQPTPLLSSAAMSLLCQRTAAPPRPLLSEAEVMRLICGRPCTTLDVYRLLDGIDTRLQLNESAITAFVDAIIGVFQRPSGAERVAAHAEE